MNIRSHTLTGTGKSEVRSQKKLFFILVLLSVICFLFSVMGCGKKPPEEVTKVPVNVVKVKKGNIDEILFYVGDIKAQDEATVYPKVTGKIIEKIAKEGDSVKKGDVLVFIDRDEVGFKFEKAPVESPINGLVGRIYVDKGMSVSPNLPVALVVNMDVVKVKIDVVEKDLPKVKVSQKAKIRVDAYPNEVFEGRVVEVSPVVDLLSRTAPIEIEIQNSEHRLKSGMFARVKILTKEKENVLIIPRDAIIKEDSSNYVFVVKDSKVHRQKIEIGLCENNKFEVINGLNEDELVVTMGNIRLKEGDAVEIVK